MTHTVEVKKWKPTNNATQKESARHYAECSCGWKGERRTTFVEANGDAHAHVATNTVRTQERLKARNGGRFSNPEYIQWIQWEDFIVFVVRARRPYTQRDLVTVLQNYGEGMQQSGYTISDAENEMEAIRAEIEEEARTVNNHPTS